MMSSKQNPKQQNLTDDGIQADIWDALREDETIRPLDLGSLSIKVELGEVYLDGYLKEEYQTLVESTIHSVLGVAEIHNRLQTNDSILAEIWDSLWKEDSIRSLDLGSLSIDVKDGEVYLYGHIAQENNLPRIENIVRSATGVVAVHNYLVTDRDLTTLVAQALARDERTRPYILPVNASHGWIQLGGEVPSRELQQAAEKIAAEMPDVRGVVSLPRVAGQRPDKPRRAEQPRIGAAVYGINGEVGVVTLVVVHPQDRLVTHFMVRSNEIREINLRAREAVVPVKAIDLVKNESVFLAQNGLSLNTYPAFDPDEYPLAPFTWKAPYPYTAGEVRWSIREILEPGNHPRPQHEMEPRTEIQETPDRAMAQAGI
jgi:osmotically-inducible protein OsmY